MTPANTADDVITHTGKCKVCTRLFWTHKQKTMSASCSHEDGFFFCFFVGFSSLLVYSSFSSWLKCLISVSVDALRLNVIKQILLLLIITIIHKMKQVVSGMWTMTISVFRFFLCFCFFFYRLCKFTLPVLLSSGGCI